MIWKYLRNFLEIHSSTEEKVSWTHKKAIFLFLLSESYRGFEFCSNTLKIVITVMAQINRGEQELLPPSSWHWLRITFNWEEKRRIFVQKSQHFRMKSAVPPWIVLSAPHWTEAAADTGSPATNSFIPNFQTQELQPGPAQEFVSELAQRALGEERSQGCSLRLLIVSEIVSCVSNPVGTLLLGAFGWAVSCKNRFVSLRLVLAVCNGSLGAAGSFSGFSWDCWVSILWGEKRNRMKHDSLQWIKVFK